MQGPCEEGPIGRRRNYNHVGIDAQHPRIGKRQVVVFLEIASCPLDRLILCCEMYVEDIEGIEAWERRVACPVTYDIAVFKA